MENVRIEDLLANLGSVENWTGVRGAFLADLLMNRWIGVTSYMILYFLGSMGAKLMNIRKIRLLNRFIFCLATLIWGSWFFAFFFISGYEDTFIYLGGQHGYYMTEMLKSNIGIPGTFLLLLGFFLIIAIFSSKKTIPFLQRVFTFGWLTKWTRKRADKKTGEQVEEEVDEPMDEDTRVLEEELISQPENEATRQETLNSVGGESVEERPAQPEPETLPSESSDEGLEVIIPQEEETEFSVEVAKEEETAKQWKQEDYNPRLDLSHYTFPTLDLLDPHDQGNIEVSMEDLKANQQLIKQALEDFGIKIASIKATVGPTVTLYEIIPEAGIRIAKIKTLEDDIALNLAALQIRIIAPIPGKGTIGIEVPNKNPQTVSMQSVIASKRFQECKYELPVAMGKTITNEVYMFDLCKTPHLLVAGATGQGKSVGLNAIITSLLYKKHPAELKFVIVDPKKVEFSVYTPIERHFLAKLPDGEDAIITDVSKVVQTLNSLCIEMDTRYDLLRKAGCRNIKEYNAKFISRQLNPEKGHRFMPYIVIIIDEFGDLIMTAGKEVELPICRIAQLARAVGIHAIIATQRPTTNIITGTIKANFPARVAFRVAAMMDSRTILDRSGAQQLIGKGDMLYLQGNDPVRVQCAFVDTPEVEKIAAYISRQQGYPTAFLLP